jgi:membrane-associated phospholipid phosphatase
MKDFLTLAPRAFVRIFSGKNIIWHFLAIAVTYFIVVSGIDWLYFTSVQRDLLSKTLSPAVGIGFIFPIIIPLVLIIVGSFMKHKHVSLFGWALAQAAFLGWLISSVYKAFTGRVQPNIESLSGSEGTFHFGFWQHGIFWGWPSSHTTVAFAMAFTFIVLIPKKDRVLRLIAFLYAVYIGIGVSLSIHWFSDVIAGAIIGTVIGIVVGKEYTKKN